MRWLNHLKTCLAAVSLLLAMASGVVADSYARDTWDFSLSEDIYVPPEVSPIPRWKIVRYTHPMLWTGCKMFVEEYPRALAGVSASDCVDIVAHVSGLRNPDRISAGALIMVPSPNNTGGEIMVRRSQWADPRSLRGNPMGVMVALSAFNRGINDLNQRLELAEGRLGEHGVRLADQANRLNDLEIQVTTLAETAGADLSATEVRLIATEVLADAALEPGMTESEVQAQIRAALAEQSVEFEQLASDVEAMQRELAAVRSAQLSPEEYARAALEIARDIGVSENQVRSVVSQALSELDMVAPAEMSEAIGAALAGVNTRVSTLETQVAALRNELRSLRSEALMSPEAYAEAAITIAEDLGMSEADVNQAVQNALADLDLMAPDDVSEAVDKALDERDYVSRTELETALQDVAVDTPAWVWWVSLIALGIGGLALLLLWWKSRRDGRQSEGLSQRLDEVETKVTKATADAKSAKKKADKAHTLATGAAQAARVATNLGLPNGWELIGDLPLQAMVKALDNGESVTLRFYHEDEGERRASFTMAKGSIRGPDGNMVDGLLVTGISGLIKPIGVNVNNMVAKVRNGIKSNKFVGVDEKGRTNGPTPAAG